MQYLPIDRFLQLAPAIPVIDVRSPGEYEHDHIPGAVNIPLFDNEQRAEVGTIYKVNGQQAAIERGFELVAPFKQQKVDAALKVSENGRLLVHCWRGGLRSEKMAELFEQNGIACTVLEGGYKSYRRFVHNDFRDIPKLIVIEGRTGSGKTAILDALRDQGEQVIDLERAANHRGSVFGGIGLGEQPMTAQFQNSIHAELRVLDRNRRIWIEGESQRVGNATLPETLWETMNESRVVNLIVPSSARIDNIVAEYGTLDRAEIAAAMSRIDRRLGDDRFRRAMAFLDSGDLESVTRLLLEYYDKTYHFSLKKYKKQTPVELETTSGDPGINARLLTDLAERNNW